jgi:WD40 repeat protein
LGADEEEFDDIEEEEEEDIPRPQNAATLGPHAEPAREPGQLAALPEADAGDAAMDAEAEDYVSELPDMATNRCARHGDSVVAVDWNPKQPQVVVSGSCDDHAYLWRLDKDGTQASL